MISKKNVSIRITLDKSVYKMMMEICRCSKLSKSKFIQLLLNQFIGEVIYEQHERKEK